MSLSEETFHRARKALNPVPCAFEKALLAHCICCGLADKHLLAERETVNCHEAESQETCVQLRAVLRGKSAFVLKITADMNDPLPHNKEMKVQCGGLKGLQNALTGSEQVANVHGLVVDALTRYGDLESLPFSLIIQSVSNFNIRHRI